MPSTQGRHGDLCHESLPVEKVALTNMGDLGFHSRGRLAQAHFLPHVQGRVIFVVTGFGHPSWRKSD
jgi:hypothetical protein